MRIHCLSMLLLVLLCAGCGNSTPPKAIDFGKVENGIYTSNYFNMSLTLPPSWSVQDGETMAELSAKGRDIVASKNSDLKKAIDASTLTTVNLFGTFEHPPGTPAPKNCSLIAIAEKISYATGIKRGSDYLYHTKKLLEQSQLKYKFGAQVPSASLGGQTFDILEGELPIGLSKVKQRYYCIIKDGYALCFVATYFSDEDLGVINTSLESMKFK